MVAPIERLPDGHFKAYAWSHEIEGGKRRFFAVNPWRIDYRACRGRQNVYCGRSEGKMNWKLGILACALIPISGCDDGSGARQNLAKCELMSEAKTEIGGWNVSFLSTCMQAKGFVTDGRLTSKGFLDVKCGDLDYPEIDPSCYRTDDAFSAWYAGQQSHRNSN